MPYETEREKVLVKLTIKVDESVFRWFDRVERRENYKLVKSVYVGKCAGSRSVRWPGKRWIDTVKD